MSVMVLGGLVQEKNNAEGCRNYDERRRLVGFQRNGKPDSSYVERTGKVPTSLVEAGGSCRFSDI